MSTAVNVIDIPPHHATGPFVPTMIAGITPPLVGRAAELHALLAQLHAVITHGDARWVTLVGLPGIGKSRLAHEFQRLVAQLPEVAAPIRLVADRQHQGQPYQLLRQLVAALVLSHAGDPRATVHIRLEQGVAALLGDGHRAQAHFIGQVCGYDMGASPYLNGVRDDPQQLRDQALHYFAQCVDAVTRQAPLVVFCDDLQHADDGSLDALVQVAQVARHLLVVGCAQPHLYTRRPDWDAPLRHAHRFDLGPLAAHDAHQLLAAILRKAPALPPDLVQLISSHAGGHPLYLEELVKVLIADGVIVPDAAVWHIHASRLTALHLPDTLAGLLAARLRALPAAVHSALLSAAVVGRVFWAAAVQHLCGMPPDGRAHHALLTDLAARGLVVAQPESRLPGHAEYVFPHELLHEAAYAQVPAAQRQVAHRQMAAWLLTHARDQVTVYAGLIGEHYERGGQPDQAAQWYARAGAAARASAALRVAQRHYQAALRLLPDDLASATTRIACCAGLGAVQVELARLPDAVASYTQMAAAAAAAGDQAAAARAWGHLAMVYHDTPDLDTAFACGQRAVGLAQQVGDPHLLATVLVYLGWTELHREHLAAARDLGHQALRLLGDLQDPLLSGRCASMLGMAYERAGDYGTSWQYLHEAVCQLRASGHDHLVASQLSNMGYTANRQGDFAAAVDYLAEAQQIAHTIGSRMREIYVRCNQATARNGLEDYVGAEQAARQGIMLSEACRMSIFPSFYADLAEAVLGQGRTPEAVEAARQALTLATAQASVRECAIAWRAMGLAMDALDDPQGAAACFGESARRFAALGDDGEQAHTLRAWARHEGRHGDPARGQALWRQARDLFARAHLAQELARTPLEPPATRQRSV